MPRLFTGLEIPLSVAMALGTLRGGLNGARWIDAENYHVTLRFAGDIDARKADDFAHGSPLALSSSTPCGPRGGRSRPNP